MNLFAPASRIYFAGRAVLALLIFLAFAVTVPGQSQGATVAEQYLLSALNQERTSRGMGPVHLDTALHQAAFAHARLMADHRAISHRFSEEPELSIRASNAGARFDRITENVAEGPSVVVLHDAWMHSSGHRANILDSAVDAVGISVVERDGQLYAVEDFEHNVRTLSLEEQEAAVGLLLDAAGLELIPGLEARQTCAMASGYAGEEQPAFVMRYTTSDLSQLPSQLKTRLAVLRDHRAAVGACVSIGKSTFSMYSIAVVLYP